MEEIERKFLIKEMPDLGGQNPIRYERYYLARKNGLEDRIQKKDNKFEREVLKETSNLGRQTEKFRISQEEFEQLKEQASEAIIRDSYMVQDIPNCSIKIYHGRFEGLKRVEVEFGSEQEANNFQPPAWLGKEITNSALGRDSRLLDLSEQEFTTLLNG